MARKSRWQQFADSFNSMYNTVSGVAQDFEIAKVNRQEFEDDQGNPLEGSALERARYKALGDIYTKYGDAERGLMLRGRLADLESAQMGNTITRETMDDQIAAAGLGNDLTRARINSANASAARSRAAAARSGSRTRAPTQAELISQALQDAMTGTAPGGGQAAPASEPRRSSGDAPVNRTPPAAPGGLAPPSAPSSLPKVSSAPTDGDVEVAKAAARPGVSGTPVVSTQGRATQQQGPGSSSGQPNDVLVGGAGSDTLDNATSPSAMTAAPNMAQMTEKLAEGVAAGGRKKKAVAQETATQGRASAEDVMMRAAENLLQAGQVDAAKKLVDGVETYGAIEALKITRDSERLRQSMNVALRRGGIGGALAVLDQYNGEDLKVDVVETSDGYSVVEYLPGEEGEVNQRVLFSGRAADDIRQGFITYTMDPVESADYTAQILANKKARAELELKRKEIPGSDANERAINWLTAEPNNPRAQLYAETTLGLAPDQIADFATRVAVFEDSKRARSGTDGSRTPPPDTQDTDAGDPPPATPAPAEEPEPSTGSSASRRKSRGGLRDTGPSANDRAREIALGVWRRAMAARQAGPSGLASSPSAGDTSPEAIMERVYAELRRDPSMQGFTEQYLQQLAQEAVMSAAR